MEERIYRYVNKSYEGVDYVVTQEEYEVLHKSYCKEKYINHDQYLKMNTWNYSDMGEEDQNVEEWFADDSMNVLKKVEISDLIERLYALLTPEEKTLVLKHLIEGYHMTELEQEMGVSVRQLQRYKKSALDKMRKYLEDSGIRSYEEAMK